MEATMINLNCHIYRCGPNENYGLSDQDFRDTDKSMLQEPVKDAARLEWQEVTKVVHYYLSVNAMTQPMMVREDQAPYGEDG
jgi:hypothetical protein